MVVKKAEFVMLLFQSTPSTGNVSSSSQNIFDLLLSELGKKFDESQKFMQDMLLSRNDRVDKLDKGKGVNHTYSGKDLNPSPSILHPQLTEYMVCQQIISLGSHHRQAQFGHPEPNQSNRSHQLVRLVLWLLERSDRSNRLVRPVPWCWPQRHHQHLRQFHVWLTLAVQMN